jgi:hypothetical protein
MQNKPASNKSWNEIEILISTIAIALTLSLWNLFASKETASAAAAYTSATLPPQPDTSTIVSITPTPSLMLQPGQVLLLGGALPTVTGANPSNPVTSSVQPRSGGGKSAPPPVTKTHSSHHP